MSFNMNEKSTKKIIGYLVPVVALAIASGFGLDAAGLESALSTLVAAVFGVLGALGVLDDNKKTEKEKQKYEARKIKKAKG